MTDQVLRIRPANRKQEAFLHSTTRYSLLSGAVRAGKSYIGCARIISKGVKYGGSRSLICRKSNNSLPESTAKTFFDLIPSNLIVYRNDNKGLVRIKTEFDGVYTEITFSGLDKGAEQEYPTKIGSREYGDIFFDETSEGEKGDWEMLVTRLNYMPPLARDPENWRNYVEEWAHERMILRAGGEEHVVDMLREHYKDYVNQMFGATNPESNHHFLYKFFFKCRRDDFSSDEEYESARAEREVWLTTPYDNRKNLPEGYIETLERTLTGVQKERLLYGKWVAATGLIWKDFNREVHVTDNLLRLSDYQELYFGADANFQKPRAGLVIGIRSNGVDILDEFYEERVHVESLIEWLQSYAFERDETMCGVHDPADPSAVEKINTSDMLVCDKAINKVVEGISTVSKYFTTFDEDGMPAIRIHPRCVNLIDELLSYRWKSGANKDTPVKEKDHLCDALRYALHSRDGGTASYSYMSKEELRSLR